MPGRLKAWRFGVRAVTCTTMVLFTCSHVILISDVGWSPDSLDYGCSQCPVTRVGRHVPLRLLQADQWKGQGHWRPTYASTALLSYMRCQLVNCGCFASKLHARSKRLEDHALRSFSCRKAVATLQHVGDPPSPVLPAVHVDQTLKTIYALECCQVRQRYMEAPTNSVLLYWRIADCHTYKPVTRLTHRHSQASGEADLQSNLLVESFPDSTWNSFHQLPNQENILSSSWSPGHGPSTSCGNLP